MRNIKVTTKIAFAGLSLIKKLGIKEDLIEFFTLYQELNNKSEQLIFGLYNKKDIEVTKENTLELLKKSPEVEKEINDINNQLNSKALNFMTDVLIESVPNCEDDFYKFISLIEGITKEEAERLDISEVVEIIVQLFQSKSFMGLFSQTINQK